MDKLEQMKKDLAKQLEAEDPQVAPSSCLPRSQLKKPHMAIKRFKKDDPKLSAAARKGVPYNAMVDMAPNGRSSCHVCHEIIAKDTLRIGLQLQCHRGFKTAAYNHGNGCIWRNPETYRLVSIDELHGLSSLPPDVQEQVRQAFADNICARRINLGKGVKGAAAAKKNKEKVKEEGSIEAPTVDFGSSSEVKREAAAVASTEKKRKSATTCSSTEMKCETPKVVACGNGIASANQTDEDCHDKKKPRVMEPSS